MIVSFPSAQRAARWLSSLVATFILLGLIAAFAATHREWVAAIPGDTRFVQMFLMDLEYNAPTWFSTVLLLTASLALAGTAQSSLGSAHRRSWTWLSRLFLFLSLDEAVSLHEKLIPVGRKLGMSGLLSHSWIVAGAALVVVLFFLLLPLLRSLPNKTLRHFLLSAALYLSGVLVVESIGGLYAESHGYTSFAYYLITSLEEGLEMTGIATFIWALLTYQETASPGGKSQEARA